MEREQMVLVGCYTQPVPHEPKARGPGIVTLGVSEGTIRVIATTPPSETGPNPSYLAVSANGRDVFAVNEVPDAPDGTVTRLRLRGDGGLERVAQAPSGGCAPAHVAVVPDGLVVANFGSGTVSTLATGARGLALVSTTAGARGDSHVHQALPLHFPLHTAKYILTCDPTGDTVTLYARTPAGALTALTHYKTPAGSYPRHATQDVQTPTRVHIALAKAGAILSLTLTHTPPTLTRSRYHALPPTGTLGAIHATPSAIVVSSRGAPHNGLWHVPPTGAATRTRTGGRVPRDFCAVAAGTVVVHQGCGRVALVGGGAAAALALGARAAPVCAVAVPAAVLGAGDAAL